MRKKGKFIPLGYFCDKCNRIVTEGTSISVTNVTDVTNVTEIADAIAERVSQVLQENVTNVTKLLEDLLSKAKSLGELSSKVSQMLHMLQMLQKHVTSVTTSQGRVSEAPKSEEFSELVETLVDGLIDDITALEEPSAEITGYKVDDETIYVIVAPKGSTINLRDKTTPPGGNKLPGIILDSGERRGFGYIVVSSSDIVYPAEVEVKIPTEEGEEVQRFEITEKGVRKL